jgi:tetratricopeptide (TPR) repeat protein
MEVLHGRELVSQANTVEEADLAQLVARYDHERGAYRSAEALCRIAVRVEARLLGPEHPDTLISMNNLAETMKAQGDLASARQLHEQLLDISRRVLGQEHPATLNSMNNLAATMNAQGDLAGARKLKEQVLEVSQQVRGQDDPFTLRELSGSLRKSGPAWEIQSNHRYQVTGNRESRTASPSACLFSKKMCLTLLS